MGVSALLRLTEVFFWSPFKGDRATTAPLGIGCAFERDRRQASSWPKGEPLGFVVGANWRAAFGFLFSFKTHAICKPHLDRYLDIRVSNVDGDQEQGAGRVSLERWRSHYVHLEHEGAPSCTAGSRGCKLRSF